MQCVENANGFRCATLADGGRYRISKLKQLLVGDESRPFNLGAERFNAPFRETRYRGDEFQQSLPDTGAGHDVAGDLVDRSRQVAKAADRLVFLRLSLSFKRLRKPYRWSTGVVGDLVGRWQGRTRCARGVALRSWSSQNWFAPGSGLECQGGDEVPGQLGRIVCRGSSEVLAIRWSRCG